MNSYATDDVSPDPTVLIRAARLAVSYPGVNLLSELSFIITPGLTLIRGGAGRGKSTLLRVIAGEQQPRAGSVSRRAKIIFWENPTDADPDPASGREWLRTRRTRFPDWNTGLETDLIDEFGLADHVGKDLHMLSKGSHRKLGLVAAFACGAPVVLLDTPFAALDGPSSRLLAELLAEASNHPNRAWVVADFELPADLDGVPLSNVIELGD